MREWHCGGRSKSFSISLIPIKGESIAIKNLGAKLKGHFLSRSLLPVYEHFVADKFCMTPMNWFRPPDMIHKTFCARLAPLQSSKPTGRALETALELGQGALGVIMAAKPDREFWTSSSVSRSDLADDNQIKKRDPFGQSASQLHGHAFIENDFTCRSV
jgi:hypothetical protein